MAQSSLVYRRQVSVAGVIAAVAVMMVGLLTGSAAAAEGTVVAAPGATAVPGHYVVVLKDGVAPAQAAAAIAGRYGGTVEAVWQHALRGFAVVTGERSARAMAADHRVAYVQQDAEVHAVDTQPNPPSWGLDRIDQRNLPLDQSYSYATTAGNVRAYIIDTGIRITHSTFGGRATWGFNAVDSNNTDCHGHGTHVAGTVGGAQYGVAKAVRLVAVKVLNCFGSGTFAQVISGVDWVTQNAVKPAVANMSLGGGAYAPLDTAVRNSINSGVTYAIAAGNSNADACGFSPARTIEAITVNASDINDNRASFSNFGTCTDIFAPGVNITSSWNTSDTATNTISGTSMAAPHVAGAAALYLATHPGDSPATVQAALVAAATPNKIINPGAGSPNRLLFTGSTAGWSGWESLGGGLTSGPGVSSWAAGRLDVFVRGLDNALWHRWYQGGWSGWVSLGGVLTSDPAAVSWGSGRIDVFARGADNTLIHKWYQGGWSGWESLGGVLTSGPAVSSWAAGRLDVFVRGTDNGLHHRAYQAGWSAWVSLGGGLASAPAAVSWGSGRIDVFARGTDNALWHRWYQGGWGAWGSLGGVLTSGPGVSSWAAGRLDVFVRGTDNGLHHRAYQAGWSGWESLGGALTSDPDAVSWGLGRIDVFARGSDNTLHHKWYG